MTVASNAIHESCPDWMRPFEMLSESWNRTRETLARMRDLLAAEQRHEGVHTVAVAGSLGRLEQTDASDVDLIIVTALDSSEDPARETWDALRPLELPLPKPDGIYGRPVFVEQLCSQASLGVVDESVAVFGQRMQLLIEGRPVRGETRFRHMQRAILERFAGDADNSPADVWRTLLDDLLRYHRSLCVHYARVERERRGNWRELVVKAGHSRLLGIAGLLFLLGESSRGEGDAFEFVVEQIPLTPLQRIASAYHRAGDSAHNTVLRIADRFLSVLSAGIDAARFEELQNNAAALKRELLRFILKQVETSAWPRRFLEHLIL